MKPVKLFITLALMVSGVAHAQEHPACGDLDYRYEALASHELRSIAASCQSESVTNLYYNRAHHADLVNEARTLAGLISHSNARSSTRFETYQLYMTLVEQMAPTWYADVEERADFLNREYDQRGEIARRRLRGYDHIADYLERKDIAR